MDKPKRIPDFLAIGLFCAVAFSATLLAGSGNGRAKPVDRLSRGIPSAPQGQPPSGSTRPQAATPQPTAPAGATQGVPAPAAAAPGTQPLESPGAQPAARAGGQPAAPTAPQGAAPAGGQAASPDGRQASPPPPSRGQGAAPTSGTPPTSGVVREKETKETKESKEIKDHPSDWAAVVSAFFGMVSAFAWPGASSCSCGFF